MNMYEKEQRQIFDQWPMMSLGGGMLPDVTLLNSVMLLDTAWWCDDVILLDPDATLPDFVMLSDDV